MRTKLADIDRDKIDVLGVPIQQRMLSRLFATLADYHTHFSGQSDDGRFEELFEMIAIGFVDHGLSPPSTICARLAASCEADLVKCLISALATMGQSHVPAEGAMTALAHGRAEGVGKTLLRYKRVPGFGHPIHDEDPRVEVLLQRARALFPKCDWEHLKTARDFEATIPLPMNFAGALAVLALDLRIDVRFVQLAAIMGRLVGLTGHVIEQTSERKRVICYDPTSRQLLD